MIKSSHLLICLIAINLFFLVLISILLFSINQVDESKYKAFVINNEGKIGYEIYFSEKLIIKQSLVPSVKGEKRFKSEEDAKKVAELVLDRLNNGESPSVTSSEMEDLGIKIIDEEN